MKINAVYKITNTITGDFYIGSSKNVKSRWAAHKCPSTWNEHPNNPMYQDMQKYGLDNFELQILEEVETESLKETEQQLIETLKPTYNDRNANGWNIERYKKYYQQNREKQIEYQKEYYQQNREKRKEYKKEYNNQLCLYNGEVLTLNALVARFYRAGIEHPVIEAKKYIIKN